MKAISSPELSPKFAGVLIFLRLFILTHNYYYYYIIYMICTLAQLHFTVAMSLDVHNIIAVHQSLQNDLFTCEKSIDWASCQIQWKFLHIDSACHKSAEYLLIIIRINNSKMLNAYCLHCGYISSIINKSD